MCRAIGVNRSQFSRYLLGEACPRPELLLKICNYFGIDANIPIRPLMPERPAAPEDALRLSFNQFLNMLPAETCHLTEARLPSGLCRVWRRSCYWPGLAEKRGDALENL